MSLSALPASPDAVCPSGDAILASSFASETLSPTAAVTRGIATLPLVLRHAGPRTVRIAWECVGASQAPLIVVQGGISAGRHVASSTLHPESGWWQEQGSAGRALDSAGWRRLSIDWLGADGCFDHPIDPSDQADAIAALLDALGLGRVHAFVGASYGAMVGLQFAARHGARLDRLVAISGAHRAHPQATALRVVQRRIVRLGRSEASVRDALALARALAVIGYRSAEEFDARFDQAAQFGPGGARFVVEDYFDAVGARFVARFSPTAYLRLSESIDLQRLDPAAIRVPTDLIAVEQDQIVPRADLEALAAGIADRCRLHCIASRYGHDAFLKEVDTIGALLRATLHAGGVA
jgi:homoserine O-acetyltransferase